MHRPRIYRYFRDKDELITAVIIREFRALSAHRAAMFPVRGPVGPLITKVLIAGLERLGEDEFLSQVMSGDYTSLTLACSSTTSSSLKPSANGGCR